MVTSRPSVVVTVTELLWYLVVAHDAVVGVARLSSASTTLIVTPEGTQVFTVTSMLYTPLLNVTTSDTDVL